MVARYGLREGPGIGERKRNTVDYSSQTELQIDGHTCLYTLRHSM